MTKTGKNSKKIDFISVVSHQLKTPLTAMRWNTELLLDEQSKGLTKQQKELITDIEASRETMSLLVNELLNVSRIEAKTYTMSPVALNVVTVLKEALSELKPKIKEKKLKLSVDVKKNIPKILADPVVIKIVLSNLLSNAVKYTPAGRKITVVLQKRSRDLLLMVQDTGIGIPKDEQSSLFQKLYRASNAERSGEQGFGLGLYIVKSILDESNGKIWLKSGQGKGTAFFVSLPLKGMRPKKGTKTLA